MKTWLITGCSSGLGRAIALAAYEAGNRVIATARRVEKLDYFPTDEPDRLLLLPLDVQDRASIAAAVREAKRKFGSVDVLVNNAGFGYFASVEESEDIEIQRLFAVNVFGLADMTNAILPGMREQRSGTVVNISSIGGLRAYPALGWYNATKFAVEAVSESLSQEVAPLGIKVLIVEPSGFATEWAGNSASFIPEDKRIVDYNETVHSVFENFSAGAGKEPGDPDRAAKAIINAVDAQNPPLRLPVGNYAVDGALEKLEQVRSEILAWEQVSRSTDFPERHGATPSDESSSSMK